MAESAAFSFQNVEPRHSVVGAAGRANWLTMPLMGSNGLMTRDWPILGVAGMMIGGITTRPRPIAIGAVSPRGGPVNTRPIASQLSTITQGEHGEPVTDPARPTAAC